MDVVMIGFPGTGSATWMMMGRIVRRSVTAPRIRPASAATSNIFSFAVRSSPVHATPIAPTASYYKKHDCLFAHFLADSIEKFVVFFSLSLRWFEFVQQRENRTPLFASIMRRHAPTFLVFASRTLSPPITLHQ